MAKITGTYAGTLLIKYQDGTCAAFTFSGFDARSLGRELQSRQREAARNNSRLIGFKGWCVTGTETHSADWTEAEMDEMAECLILLGAGK